MLKTYLYVPDQIAAQINLAVKTQKRSKAAIIREALERGIKSVQQQSTASAQILLKIAALGKRNKVKGPKDSSTRFDEYLWDKDWSKNEN